MKLSCCWEVLQDLGYDHLPILLTFPLSPVFRPNEHLPSLNFQNACWDDFAFYFDCHCPSAEEYLSLFLSSAAVLFTSLTLNALRTIWCSGQTALFLLAKAALAYMPTALSVAPRPPFSFQQTQYAQVFPLKHAPFCKFFAGLGSTNKSVTFVLFSYLTLALFSPLRPLLHLSFYLTLSGRCGRNCFLSPVRSGHNGSLDTRFSRETTRLMNWPDGERYSCSLQSLLFLSSYLSYPLCLFSDWRRTVSSKFLATQVPSISTEELVLPRHVRCVLSRPPCNRHSLLLCLGLPYLEKQKSGQWMATFHETKFVGFSNFLVTKAGRWDAALDLIVGTKVQFLKN